MEFSQIFGFLIIFKDSIKILSKNGKFMTPITILSLLLPSILLLAVTHTYQSWTDFMTKSSYSSYIPTISFSALLLLVEIAFGIAFVKISHASGVAAILVTATSYTDSATSARDLCSRIRAACRMKLQKNKLSGSMAMSTPALLSLVLTLLILLLAVLFYLDPAAIFVAIVVVDLVCVYQLYYLVVPVMSRVVSVVEERGGRRRWRGRRRW